MRQTGIGAFGLGDYTRGGPLEDMTDDASEYGWGAGLVPEGLENADPSQGGMYKGGTPECPP